MRTEKWLRGNGYAGFQTGFDYVYVGLHLCYAYAMRQEWRDRMVLLASKDQ